MCKKQYKHCQIIYNNYKFEHIFICSNNKSKISGYIENPHGSYNFDGNEMFFIILNKIIEEIENDFCTKNDWLQSVQKVN